jgi:tRNA-splicing ligase RtcB
MKPAELVKMGIPRGTELEAAVGAVIRATKSGLYSKDQLRKTIEDMVADPAEFASDPFFGEAASALMAREETDNLLHDPISFRVYGDEIEELSLQQMRNACRLPVAVAGALMPDAHAGYGLPIGGVLAVESAVIPYAVGVDIGCRMKMSVLDLPLSALEDEKERLIKALVKETAFGNGAKFKKRRRHRVMDEDWEFCKVVSHVKDTAWSQLGTSGGGNHFVEYGVLHVESPVQGLAPGTFVALLSHSGSRGAGNIIGKHFSAIARSMHPRLPKEAAHLAWLDLDSSEGREYWLSMELMGRYSAANHELIHTHITEALGVEITTGFENHHNFAWKEKHLGRDVIVHRKGATPAGKDMIGIIPGSMATPGFVVRGKGDDASLRSASHGAGRLMSRTQAKQRFSWDEALQFLARRGVTLVSADLDEVPMAYKDIGKVMAAQADLVEILARFEPRIVKMAGSRTDQRE